MILDIIKLMRAKQSNIKDQQRAGTTTGYAAKSARDSTYQIKMTLKGFRPPIWRRFMVPGNISLHELHEVLQALMEWEDYHLHEFRIGDARFGEPDTDDSFWEVETKDDWNYKLYRVAKQEKARFIYIYDFGDSWEHELLVEKIIPSVQKLKNPVCLGGKRAGPPEDSGGIWGYQRFLDILKTPPLEDPDEEVKVMREWIGEDFDPERFDPEEINRRLSALK